jgi:hypothetical protein
MFRVTSALAALLIVFLASAAPAGAITNGTPDGYGHPYVGMVYNEYGVCSGTLISPTVFLTAGHCTADFEYYGLPVYVTFQPEADFTFDPAQHLTGTPYTHPNFCLGCAPGLPGFATYDVGVVVLDEPYEGVGFGSLPYERQVNDLGKGSTLTALGYGTRGFIRGGGPPQPVGLADRYVANVSFINANNALGDMFLKHSTNGSQGQGGTCSGDSGGPIFAADHATVLGVTSFGGGNCNSVAYAQRIDHPDVLGWLYANFAL